MTQKAASSFQCLCVQQGATTLFLVPTAHLLRRCRLRRRGLSFLDQLELLSHRDTLAFSTQTCDRDAATGSLGLIITACVAAEAVRPYHVKTACCSTQMVHVACIHMACRGGGQSLQAPLSAHARLVPPLRQLLWQEYLLAVMQAFSSQSAVSLAVLV